MIRRIGYFAVIMAVIQGVAWKNPRLEEWLARPLSISNYWAILIGVIVILAIWEAWAHTPKQVIKMRKAKTETVQFEKGDIAFENVVTYDPKDPRSGMTVSGPICTKDRVELQDMAGLFPAGWRCGVCAMFIESHDVRYVAEKAKSDVLKGLGC